MVKYLRVAAVLGLLTASLSASASPVQGEDWGGNGTSLAVRKPAAPASAKTRDDWGTNGRAVNAVRTVTAARLTKIKLAR